jgi:hypothetical protein
VFGAPEGVGWGEPTGVAFEVWLGTADGVADALGVPVAAGAEGEGPATQPASRLLHASRLIAASRNGRMRRGRPWARHPLAGE